MAARMLSTPDSDESGSDGFCNAYTDVRQNLRAQLESQDKVVMDYNGKTLSTMGVFLNFFGTVLARKLLWMEQFLVLAIFGVILLLCYLRPPPNYATSVTADAEAIHSFIEKLSTMTTFLLGFYLSLSVSRWWRLRTEGVGTIVGMCNELTALVSQLATDDQQVLAAIRRYIRASLVMIFMQRKYGPERLHKKLHELIDMEILTQDEVEQLTKVANHVTPQSPWAWILQIVVGLRKRGAIKSDEVLSMLAKRVLHGVGAVGLITAQLGSPIPLPYVHLLCLVVKIHNLCAAVMNAYLIGAKLQTPSAYFIIFFQFTNKVMIVPFLFNALLIICEELQDPFGGGMNDFPMHRYELGMESGGLGIIKVAREMPDVPYTGHFGRA